MTASALAWLAFVAFMAGVFGWLFLVLIVAAGARIAEAVVKAYLEHRL